MLPNLIREWGAEEPGYTLENSQYLRCTALMLPRGAHRKIQMTHNLGRALDICQLHHVSSTFSPVFTQLRSFPGGSADFFQREKVELYRISAFAYCTHLNYTLLGQCEQHKRPLTSHPRETSTRPSPGRLPSVFYSQC